MQQRSIFYTLQQILSADLLGAQVYSLIGDANGLQAVLGQTQSVISNLLLAPTSPASLTLNVTNGFLASLQPVDASSYGSLSANTQTVLQLAFNLQTDVVINNTLSAGEAQYVLVEAGFQQQDSNAVVLPYVNISTPAVPYSGPGNTGIAQDTIRNEVCVLTVKYGSPATSGDEIPPTVDAGQVAISYIDLEAAQTTITSGQILDPSTVLANTGHGSPTQVLAGLLNKHHTGAIGTAPQIDLTDEVKNFLPMANLLASNIVGGVTALRQGSGNPNGVLAGNSNRNNVPDTYYDFTNNAYYVCTTTGNTSTTVWTSTNIPSSHQINLKTFTTSGSYTPTTGTKYLLVAVCGAGGGGAGADGTVFGGESGGGGGGGSSAVTLIPATGLTFPATITIGTGGAGITGTTMGNAGSGNNSQFSTTELGTSLTGYGGQGGLNSNTVPDNTTSYGGQGGGVLQSAPLMGTVTISSVAYPYLNIFGTPGESAGGAGDNPSGANGGSSVFGGGGLGGFLETNGQSGGYGSGGGSSGFNNHTTQTGGNGTNGVCVVIEYVGN